MHFNPQNIQIVPVLDQVIELQEHDIEKKEITINQNIPENFTVFADKNMMASVFRNLINNALKFTEKKGQISIDASNHKTFQLLGVRDTGKGMSQKAMSRLFSETQVLSERGTENEEGSGLGLSICKEFINKHNGKIWVEKNKDIGLTFFIRLPQEGKTA